MVIPCRVLVLGASGFIGQRIVAALAASGWATPVAAIHRTALPRALAVETLRLDARNPAALREALARVDAVVNAVTGDAETIVEGARGLFETCSSLPSPPKIVHLSTMMVYGTATGLVPEDSPLRGDWDDYSAAKAQVEQIARGHRSIVSLRPGIVYGPGSPIWSERIGRWLCAGRLGDLGAAGQGFCNLVHVDDLVAAILSALRTPGVEGQAFNIAMPDPPTWNEYFRLFAAALDAPYATISSGRLWFELRVAAGPLKIAEILAHRLNSSHRPPEPIRPWLLRLCAHPIQLDPRKAVSGLGVQYRPLSEGLDETVRWIRNRST